MAEVGELYGCNARSGVLLLLLPFFLVCQLSADFVAFWPIEHHLRWRGEQGAFLKRRIDFAN
jgi:hypothetical protein